MTRPFFLLVLLILAGQVFSQHTDSLWVAKQVDSLIQVSRGLTGIGDFDNALELNVAAEKLALEKFGRESAPYGNICFNFGRVLYFKGDYSKSEKWYLESKAIREKVLGKEQPGYAWSLNNLGLLYGQMGDYKKAEQCYLESKAIRERVLGKEHPDYASSLNNLAILYVDVADYEKAELLYLESKNIRERVLGRDHPDYGWSLNNLALLYWNMGEFEKAEPLYLENKAFGERVLGKDHPDYASALNNLAIFYWDIGNYEKAEPLHLEAKAIREKALGKEHFDYATSLGNLALLYTDMGRYKEAEMLYLETKDLRAKVLGKEHIDYAKTLNNLANLYADMGLYEKSEPYYLESRAILGQLLGEEHPDYIAILENIADDYAVTGQYEKAESLYLGVKAIREKVLGKGHPDYAESLNKVAMLYWNMGSHEIAGPMLDELDSLTQRLLVNGTHHLSEREMGSYLARLSIRQNQIFSFNQLTNEKKSSGARFNNVLFHKGFLLNAGIRASNPILHDAATAETFYHLKSCHRRLATEYAKPIAERNGVEELESKANDLEKELASRVLGTGYGEVMRQVKWQEVQAALKPGEAAIEFVHYRFWDKKPTDSVMYAALVLLPEGRPEFIPLFEEKQLDALLHRGGTAPEVFFKNLYEFSGTGQHLNRLIWQPIAKVLSIGKGLDGSIYFSPSGLLHRLNLAALPVSESERLGDRFKLIELGSTRQIAANPQNRYDGPGAVLFGGVYYDPDTTAVATGQRSKPSGLRGGMSFANTDPALRGGGDWKFLPGSEKEITELEKIMSANGLKTQVFRSVSATEEAFKNTESTSKDNSTSPRILHISTHGYFFPDPKTTSGHSRSTFADNQPAFKTSEHPMLRSGLILAGGNHAWKTGRPVREGMEDGILTAYEISQINLSNTELVVLSACETGLGDIQGNEGVYGLQRAFRIAGVKYLVMSLWQVDDKQTSRLMTLFYKNWLTEKMPVPEALRAAQNEFRKRGFDPFYWAGFVVVE